MDLEQTVAQHYAQGSLEARIWKALAASGKDLAQLTPADLAPVDEFHVGGRQATVAFAQELGAAPGDQLLDIGSGLGGASRYFAQERGCQVTGIDLTGELVSTAQTLAVQVGLAGRVSYRQGSALAMPFAAQAFDGAYMLHVGMNIEDKAALFAEVRRVLKPGGGFGIYDVLGEGAAGELPFPLPWARTPATSFVQSLGSYGRLLEEAGFRVERTRDRSEFALGFLRRMRPAVEPAAAAPQLGLHLLLGEAAPRMFANLMATIARGQLAPVEIICRADA
jgi:SAM-dependent methyltransferase